MHAAASRINVLATSEVTSAQLKTHSYKCVWYIESKRKLAKRVIFTNIK
jgi:hypothetical protein